MNDQEINRKQLIDAYKPDAEKLYPYISWLENRKGEVSHSYHGEGLENGTTVLPFTVYDNTLMNFVKIARKTSFMNKNYPYIYRKYRLEAPEDEKAAIEKVKLKDIELLGGILSKYVLEGARKSGKWAEGVEQQIYLEILCKLRTLLK